MGAGILASWANAESVPLAALTMRKGESGHDLRDEWIESLEASDYGDNAWSLLSVRRRRPFATK
jgi:hypothetical protein